MVDQNSSPNEPSSGHSPEPSREAKEGLSSPSVVKAGEMMLIFALLLIFIVCICLAIHFHLKRQKRRRKKQAKPKKEVGGSKCVNEAKQEQDKNFSELVGTPLCEMGESEPRHEMEDVEVPERYTMNDPEDPRNNPVYSPAGTDLEAGTVYFGEMTSSTMAQPEPAMHAAYFARF
jgi:hypothetical protein